jgi:hypothetical protein
MKEPFHEIRHEGPFATVFEDQTVRLGIGALTLDVVRHRIVRPRKTWVKEASEPREKEIDDSYAGVIYGRGNVEFSRTRGTIDVDDEEVALVPHGEFEPLTADERERYPGAGWKFRFDYTVPPFIEPS